MFYQLPVEHSLNASITSLGTPNTVVLRVQLSPLALKLSCRTSLLDFHVRFIIMIMYYAEEEYV